MIQFIKLVLLLCCALAASSCCAQGPAVDVLDSDDDVLDAFAIGNTVVAYLVDDLPSENEAVNSVKRIVPVARAAKAGRVRAHARSVIEFSLGEAHKTELLELSAQKPDGLEAGFIWKVRWILWPTKSNLGGVPWEYRTWLRPNGKPIDPHFYLTDFVALNNTGDDLAFSVMPFVDADPGREHDPISDAEARAIATAAVDSFIKEHSINAAAVTLNYKAQSLIELPVSATDNQTVIKRKLWAVEFARSLADEKPPVDASLTVWVSADGIVSKLTLNEWSRETRRTTR